ncbi:hypothetical protein EMIT043CA1_120041 [Pseudomonas brassicacearum]
MTIDFLWRWRAEGHLVMTAEYASANPRVEHCHADVGMLLPGRVADRRNRFTQVFGR